VELHVANPITFTATQNPDGTYTVVVTYRGQTDTISIPHGPVLLMDTGMISSALTLDSSGNFLSQTLIAEHGPHPLEDSDLDTTGYALLCQTVTAALT
jgi:hypothetical protein